MTVTLVIYLYGFLNINDEKMITEHKTGEKFDFGISSRPTWPWPCWHWPRGRSPC